MDLYIKRGSESTIVLLEEGTDEALGFEYWCTKERDGCYDDDPEVVCTTLESLYGLWIERYCNDKKYHILVEYDCEGT
jgi:hypothetical protein